MIVKIQHLPARRWIAALIITAALATSTFAFSSTEQSMATQFDSATLIADDVMQDNGGG